MLTGSCYVMDKARGPLKLLEVVTEILQARHRAKIAEYRQELAAIARQPVDRSAAACLDLVSPLEDDKQHSLVNESCEKWESMLDSETEFAVGQAVVFHVYVCCFEKCGPYLTIYPVTPDTVSCLAAAVSHLVLGTRCIPEYDSRRQRLEKLRKGCFRARALIRLSG